jgi:hypothetical protein
VPVEDSADKRRDERDLCLCARDGLAKPKEQGKVAVDVVLLLELARRLDPLPRRGNLDEDPVLADPDRLVELNQVAGLQQKQSERGDPAVLATCAPCGWVRC